MEFVVFCLVIALIVVIVRYHSFKVQTREELQKLNKHLENLYKRYHYLYDEFKEFKGEKTESTETRKDAPKPVSTVPASNAPVNPYSAAHKPSSAPSVNRPAASTVNRPASTVSKPVSQPASVFSANSYAKPASQTVAPVKTAAAAPVKAATAPVKAAATPVKTAAAANPYKGSADIPEKTAAQALREAQPAPKFVTKQKKVVLEQWLGVRLFNIAASLMIFIGLILFCTLPTDVVTNTAKMIALFLVSGGFIAVGSFLTYKDKSAFSLGMLGTGFGSFFISILLSHVYFKSLGDIAAFGLILVWAAFALFMSKKLDSVMLSVTAHIGTAISICFAFSLGFTKERVVLLVIYQLAALAVIIIGNIFCCRKTYRFGLIMSQCLLLYTSIAMNVAFGEKFIMPQSISAPTAAVVYAIQFIAISFISYLVATSSDALEKQGGKGETIAFIVQLANKLLWSGGMIASVGYITYLICKNALHIPAVIPCSLSMMTAALLHLILTLVLEMKLNFSEKLTTISVWIMTAFVIFTSFAVGHDIGMPFLFVYALLMIGAFKLTKLPVTTHTVVLALITDACYMTFYGYFKVENVWLSIPYMTAVGAVLLLAWFVQSGKTKQLYFKYMKIAEYLWLSVSIIAINASEFSDISMPLILSEFALMNIICYFIKFGSKDEPELRMVVKVESLLTVYFGMFAITLERSDMLGSNNIIKAVMIIMLAAITGVYVYDFAKSKEANLQFVSGLTSALFLTVFAFGFYDKFVFFRIYSDTLRCRPFFFVLATALLIIYAVRKDHRLAKAIWVSMAVSMVLAVITDYHTFIDRSPSVGISEDAQKVIFCGIALVHAGILMGYTFFMSMMAENCDDKDLKAIPPFASYFWSISAFPVLTWLLLKEFATSGVESPAAMIVLILINVAIFSTNCQGERGSYFNLTVRVVSAIAFYIAVPIFGTAQEAETTAYLVACIILMLACGGLFYVKIRDIFSEKPPIAIQVYTGITATYFFNFVCKALLWDFDMTYTFSIVTMLTALLCITLGFIAKAKGMRIYGLVTMIICIIKLVTIDIVDAESLSRVVAFIVGGIICFIISGIYNRLEKSVADDDKAPDLYSYVRPKPAPVPVGVPAGSGEAVKTVSKPAPVSIEKAVDEPVEETEVEIPVETEDETQTEAEISVDSEDETQTKAEISVDSEDE